MFTKYFYMDCTQILVLQNQFDLIDNSKEHNATEYILIHRRSFSSISQQRTICTSTYKQYEDFDLMYLIKLGIDKYFEIVLVYQFRCTSGRSYQCINHRRHVHWGIVT